VSFGFRAAGKPEELQAQVQEEAERVASSGMGEAEAEIVRASGKLVALCIARLTPAAEGSTAPIVVKGPAHGARYVVSGHFGGTSAFGNLSITVENEYVT
jgi:hypothetical protein